MTLRDAAEQVETYVTDLLGERRHGAIDQVVKAILFMFSRLYRRIVLLRLRLYHLLIFRPNTLGCLVLSIGNLTVGGTGKTPVVEVFARHLARKGRRVAILSRGYRSKGKPLGQKMREFFTGSKQRYEIPPKVVSDGKHLLLNSEMAGDEPYMLASNLKEVIVLVDKDRVKSGRYAIRNFNADTLILDDGFQYLDLKPRLNILLVDSTTPFHNHHLLPRGLLREPIENIRRADFIFLTKSNGGSHLRHLKRFIKRHNYRAEVIECTHRPLYLQDIYSKTRFELSHLRGKKVASISGIAVPESFESFLLGFGAVLVHTQRYADHHRYRQQEVIDFINQANDRGAELCLTTEKDAVRFPMLERRDLPILFMRVEIDILSGHESFQDCISRICFSQLPV